MALVLFKVSSCFKSPVNNPQITAVNPVISKGDPFVYLWITDCASDFSDLRYMVRCASFN